MLCDVILQTLITVYVFSNVLSQIQPGYTKCTRNCTTQSQIQPIYLLWKLLLHILLSHLLLFSIHRLLTCSIVPMNRLFLVLQKWQRFDRDDILHRRFFRTNSICILTFLNIFLLCNIIEISNISLWCRYIYYLYSYRPNT